MILAHQGGWDEALFVIGPLLFIVALLRMAKRRADRVSQERQLQTAPTPAPDTEADTSSEQL